MFDKRLTQLCPESKKYIIGNIILQWLELALNTIMIITVAKTISKLYYKEWSMNDLTVPIMIICITLLIRFFTAQSGELAAYVLENIRGLDETMQYRCGKNRMDGMNRKTAQLTENQGKLNKLTGFNLALANTFILVFDIAMLLLSAHLYGKGITDSSGFIIPLIAFEQADACMLPYEDHRFDIVIIANALHILPEPDKALAEIRRVLKADGILIAPNFIHDNDHLISGVMSKALSAAGVVFEAKWDAPGYLIYLEEHGFIVRNAKQLASTIPMMYVECAVEKSCSRR